MNNVKTLIGIKKCSGSLSKFCIIQAEDYEIRQSEATVMSVLDSVVTSTCTTRMPASGRDGYGCEQWSARCEPAISPIKDKDGLVTTSGPRRKCQRLYLLDIMRLQRARRGMSLSMTTLHNAMRVL